MIALPNRTTALPKARAASFDLWPRLLRVLVAATAWLHPRPRPPDLPEYIRQDLGLLPDQWRGTEPIRRHPIDLTVLQGWRQ